MIQSVRRTAQYVQGLRTVRYVLYVPPTHGPGRAVRTASRGTRRPRLQLGTTTQLRLGRAAAGHNNPWGVTDPRVSRLHARVCAGPGAPTITAEGANPCVLIKALTGAQRRPRTRTRARASSPKPEAPPEPEP